MAKLFETCIMGANDDLDCKTTHFYSFLDTNNNGTKMSKTSHSEMWFQIYLPFKENVHGIKAEPPLTLTNKPKKRTYDSKKCQICEKVLSNSRNLNDHMKAVHSDKSDKPFKCTLCSYSTHVKIYLNR